MRNDYKKLEALFRGNLHSLLFRAESLEWRYGMVWYQDAREACTRISERVGYPLSVVAGVTAALSPSMPWSRNLGDAERFLVTHKAVGSKILSKRYPFGCYGLPNKKKAYDIARGKEPLEILGGPKVRAFYQCIMDSETNEVCVDGHAKCAAYNERAGINNVAVRPVEYQHLSAAYRMVAVERRIKPYQAQAIVWLTWRRLHGVEWLPDERQIPLTFETIQDEVPF